MATVVAATLLVGVVTTGFSLDLGKDLRSLLKLFGIGYIVSHYSDELNDFLNDLLRNKNVENRDMTKVVPIVSIGSGTHVGAAQVAGAKDKLEKVKAVAQGELATEALGRQVRLKVLLPVDTEKPWEGIKGVSGVGVSAVIDFRI